MKMESRIALANMKYYRKRNLMIGIAVFFATFLLFIIPTFTYNGIQLQFKAVNLLYPTWHGLFRSIPEDDIPKIASHHMVSRYGLRCDAGIVREENVQIMYTHLDENALDLYRCKLESGRWPQAENEIVTSRQALKYYGVSGEIGDVVTLPYQVYEGKGMSVQRQKEFVISGFLPELEQDTERIQYTVYVSDEFVKHELKKEDREYYFLLQVKADQSKYYHVMEHRLKEIASVFGIEENRIGINNQYLQANYVDEASIPIVVGILAVIVFAGIITIYSIYYVGLPERMREFGRLKALGTTKSQLRYIMLREGLYVSVLAILVAFLLGTVILCVGTSLFYGGISADNKMLETYKSIIKNRQISLLHLWNYLLAGGVSLMTVYLSMQQVLRKVSHVSEMQAIRYQSEDVENKHQKRSRASLWEVSVRKLAFLHFRNQKKAVRMTICAMSITGIFIMVVSTVLSCATPEESANESIYGKYNLDLEYESQNKEHPEREWNQVIARNPITEEMVERIKTMDGVQNVVSCDKIPFEADFCARDVFTIRGISDELEGELLDNIVEGKITSEELREGNKVVLNESYCQFYDLKLGDRFKIRLLDEKHTETEIEIAAVAKFEHSFPTGIFYMNKEGCSKLTAGNLAANLYIFTKKNYDEKIDAALSQIVKENKSVLSLDTWKEQYDSWHEAIIITRAAAYAFLGILSVICIMTMINTMVHSVHMRKREFGMMQAIGMTDRQLRQMLCIEGLLYAAGSIILSVGVGSLVGYPVFLWAKEKQLFSIATYYYPTTAACIVTVVIIFVQLFLTFKLSRNVKRESVIERIRYSE